MPTPSALRDAAPARSVRESAAAPRTDRRQLVGAALFYAAVAVVAQRGLVSGLADHVYVHTILGNDCLLHAWTLAWDQHALATGPCALLDANILYPHVHTLLYSDHLLGLALFVAPLRLVTANPMVVHNVATVAAPALDALALFVLARALTGSATGALVGGLLYGFAPVRLGADHCQLQMSSAWWLPLFLLVASRALEECRFRSGVLAGICLAFQGLTSIYVLAFLLPFLVLAHGWWLRLYPPRRHGRGWLALLSGETGAALAVLPFLVAYRRVQTELGTSRSLVENALLSMSPEQASGYLPVASLGVLCVAAVLWRRELPSRWRAALAPLLVLTLGSFVLACGPALRLPGQLGQIQGPYATLAALPGYDALRAPARFVQLTLLGAAPIAAGGVAAITTRLGSRRAAPVVGLLVAAVLAECRGRAPATEYVWPPARDPVSAWIRAQPATFRYVDVPINSWASMAHYQYGSTAHWHDTAIGLTGVLPPLFPYLAHELRRFPDRDVLALLSALGINHVVVHTRALPREMADRVSVLRAPPEPVLRTRFESGDTAVVALAEDAGGDAVVVRGHPIDRRDWRVSASAADSLASRAIDGDPATAWTSYGDLEAALRRPYDAVPFRDRWWRFATGMPVRFQLDLGSDVRITAIVLGLRGSDALVAPDLDVELSEDTVTWTAFPGRMRPLPDAREFIRRSAGRFAFVAAEPVRTRFVRLASRWPGEWRIGDIDVHAE